MSVKFKFLDERPLQTSDEFKTSHFGHEEIATTLIKIVKNSPAPFTIGLFAKWGAGKSTVANSLRTQLPNENIPVVIFDVWKHEGDALRRTFLNETVSQLKGFGPKFFEQNFSLDNRITQSVSRNTESKIKFRDKIWTQVWPPICLGLIFAIVTAFLSDAFGVFDKYLNFIFGIAGVTSGGGLLIWLVKSSVHLFTKETITHSVDKFQDPHEFEKEFGNILNALKHKRILIIFDNLDRVMHDKVAEVLSTIKTFLEPQDVSNESKEVIFLVPCDAKAIKKHLSNLYNPKEAKENNVFDPEEFLRKFFNTIIWIPDFIPSELESFARECLKKTEIELLDDDYVAWIITKAFRNNPRQIIQFVNILLANYLLILERQGPDKDFPPDFLKENTPQLTKYLILNQIFPEEIDILREQRALSLSETRMRDDTSKDFMKFLRETEDIQINDLRAFFMLRKSDQEKKFPGLENFIANLQDGALEEAGKQISEFGDFNDANLVYGFSQVIKQEILKTTNPVSRVNLVSTLLSILRDKQINLNGTLYEEINNLLKGSAKDHLHTISPEVLNDVFLSKKQSYRPAVVAQWIVIIEDFGSGAKKFKIGHDFILAVLNILTKQPDYLYDAQAEKLRKLLVAHFARDVEVAKLVTQSLEIRKKFVSNDYAKVFIESISDDSTYDELETSLKIVNAFDDTSLKPVGGEAVFKKFTSIQLVINQDTKPESYTEKKKVADQFMEFVNKHRGFFTSATQPIRDTFMDSLVTAFNAPSDHSLRSVFVPILYSMRAIVSDAKWQETETHIATWCGNVEGKDFIKWINLLNHEDRESLLASAVIFKTIAKRAVSDGDFRMLLIPILEDDRRAEFITRFLNTDTDSAVSYLEWLDVKDAKFILLILPLLIEKFDQGNISLKARIFNLLSEQESEMDQSQKDKFIERAKSCIVTTDVSLHPIGLEAFEKMTLSKEIRIKLKDELLTWIQSLGVPITNQRAAISWVVKQKDDLTDQDIAGLTSHLLGNVILQTNDIAMISESFSVLEILDSKYEQNSDIYDAIKNRFTSGIGDDVKNSLLEGLLLIRPKKTGSKNKDFWEWVTSQKDNE
jgi:hypothetical protein